MLKPMSHFQTTTRAAKPRERAMGTLSSRVIRKSVSSQNAGS